MSWLCLRSKRKHCWRVVCQQIKSCSCVRLLEQVTRLDLGCLLLRAADSDHVDWLFSCFCSYMILCHISSLSIALCFLLLQSTHSSFCLVSLAMSWKFRRPENLGETTGKKPQGRLSDRRLLIAHHNKPVSIFPFVFFDVRQEQFISLTTNNLHQWSFNKGFLNLVVQSIFF